MAATVFDMAEENGGAGFWIAKPSWQNTIAHVVYAGPALEYGPDPEANIVLMDVYSADAGDMKNELQINKLANRDGVWDEVYAPDWSTYKQARELSDPAIIKSLSERRDGNGNLAPQKPGKLRNRTFRLLVKGSKNLTFECSSQRADEWAEHIIPMTPALKELEAGLWYDMQVELDKAASRLPTYGTKQYRYFEDAVNLGRSDYDGICQRAEVIVKGLEDAMAKYGDLDAAQKKNLKRYAAVPEYAERMQAIQDALPAKAPAKRGKKIPVNELTEGLFSIRNPHHKIAHADLGKGKSAIQVSLQMGPEIRKILSNTPAKLKVRHICKQDGYHLFELVEFICYDLTKLKAAKLADEIESLVNEGKMLSDLKLADKLALMRGQEHHAERMLKLEKAAKYTELVAKIRFCEDASTLASDPEEFEQAVSWKPELDTLTTEFSSMAPRIEEAMTLKAQDEQFTERREILEDSYKNWRMPEMKRGFCLLIPSTDEVALNEPTPFGNDVIFPTFEGRSFEISAYHLAQYGPHLKDHIGETGRLVYGRPMMPEELAIH